MLIRDGILREVGPTRRVENLATARQAIEISADGRVVMPGFVDSHTHLLYPVPGVAADTPDAAFRALHATTGLPMKMRAKAHLEAMARHGTTTAESKTGCGVDEHAEIKILRVMAELREDQHDVAPTFLFHPPPINHSSASHIGPDCNRMRSEFLAKIARRRLAEFADLMWDDTTLRIWEGYPDRWAWFDGYFQVARSLGLACKVHAVAAHVGTAVRVAVEHNAASIDHLEHVTEADAALLGRSGTIATLLPCASFHLGGPYAPARALIDAGAPVALATNFNAHHSPSLSMQTAVALGCRCMGLTPAEAISAATINGAHAIRRADRIGSLECGKYADLLILNTSDFRDLAHTLGTNLVRTTMKRGEVIYDEGTVAPRPAEDLQPGW